MARGGARRLRHGGRRRVARQRASALTARAIPAGDGPGSLPAAAQASVSAALGRHDPRYHAVPSIGTVTATNPRRGLAASFEAGAVVIATDGESVRLTLAGAGRDGAIAPFTPVAPVARANRVELHRAGLTEWYENGPLGLEQGFTVRTRPRGTRPLVLRLHLGGTLAAKLDGRGGIAFERAGAAVLRYGGLAAWDAHGRVLPATLALAGRALTLRVDDRGARYPVTVDPFVERASLRAAAGAGGDELGTSVAVAGGTIVVGAVGDDGPARQPRTSSSSRQVAGRDWSRSRPA